LGDSLAVLLAGQDVAHCQRCASAFRGAARKNGVAGTLLVVHGIAARGHAVRGARIPAKQAMQVARVHVNMGRHVRGRPEQCAKLGTEFVLRGLPPPVSVLSTVKFGLEATSAPLD
jgi:hypothetical protein